MASQNPEASNFLSGKKIIVAGAGIAGLSFALSLRHQLQSKPMASPVIVKLYERDEKQGHINREGYSISIRGDSFSGGMQVLQKLGLLESLLDKSVSHSGNFVIWDQNWNEILRIKPQDTDLPVSSMRIARNLLRKTLVHALSPKDVIHWSTTCISADILDNGKITVELDNGQIDECDILVVADGANSKLRKKLRPDDMLSFAGAVIISGNAKFANGLPRPVDLDWGVLFSGTGTGMFAPPIDAQSAVWALSYPAPKPRTTLKPPITEAEVLVLLNEALKRGRPFQEPFASLVKATDRSTVTLFNAMDKEPFAHPLQVQSTSIIFIGDSNHAMSPFAGNGANMALMDGWELAEEICRSDSLSSAVAAYDEKSMPRSKKAIQISRWSISLAHAQGWRFYLYQVCLKMLKLFI